MIFGKKITLFLIDGVVEGRISCELSNWNGKAYRIPRSYVRKCSDRKDIDNAGVYILFGKSDSADKEGLAYIGEADGIFNRLTQHLSQKDFWNDVIVFISKDNNLNKAHIKYIESKLYEIADETGRYTLTNSNTPTRSTISEPDQAEMNEFIANIKLLIGTLGYKIFEPLISSTGTKPENILHIQAARGANARGISTDDGFVILKDSRIADSTTPSIATNYLHLREKLIESKIIVSDGNGLVVTKDILLPSPSAAACVVMGRSANGLTEWKTSSGRVLKSLEESK